MRSVWCCTGGVAALAAIFGCVTPDQIFVKFQAPGRVSGGLYADAQTLEFHAESTAPLVADVTLQTNLLRLDTHFDYDTGQVVFDGHGSALDRETHAMLLDAVTMRALSVGADLGSFPLEEQALYAALVMWEESGGIPLTQLSLAGGPSTCITPGQSYPVSDDSAGAAVRALLGREVVTADAAECDGLCGPGCAQLTPRPMWTLHCLELDACCKATDSLDCWAPNGECKEEYQRALSDFASGVDPNGEHCPAAPETPSAVAQK
jgi:hypothetical protein